MVAFLLLPLLPSCPSKMCLVMPRHILMLPIHTLGHVMHSLGGVHYKTILCITWVQSVVWAASIFLEKKIDRDKERLLVLSATTIGTDDVAPASLAPSPMTSAQTEQILPPPQSILRHECKMTRGFLVA